VIGPSGSCYGGSGRSRISPRAVEFLATDLSDYVTGAVIPIDGAFGPGIASHPPFPWLSDSSSMDAMGIELPCGTRLLPAC
jgi:hypothetical protein